MAGGNLLRLGGVSGLLAVVSMIPAYLVGYPDARLPVGGPNLL